MPGVGTILNVIVIGLAADAGIWLITQPDNPWLRGLLLVGGVVGNGLAGAIYIGAQLGPGPRDGLWMGLVRRTGRSVRFWRTVIEVGVLVVGFALGGTVGIGTVLYALTIGPIVQFFLPLAHVRASDGSVQPHWSGTIRRRGTPRTDGCVMTGPAVGSGDAE
jgi:uncharacterized membrane protein YczE